MADWLENDSLFESELRTGHRYQEIAARILREHGIPVYVTPYRFRRTLSERHEFSDEYDLLVDYRYRTDVKSKRKAFTCPDDFPYPDAYVYSKRGWDAKSHKPSAVLIISQATEGIVVVPSATAHEWEERRTHDGVRQIDEYSVLVADRGLLQPLDWFVALVRNGRHRG